MSVSPNPSPTAKILYPKEYKVEVNITDSSPNSTGFRTHHSNTYETYHGIIKKMLIPGRLTLEALSRVVEPMPGEGKEAPAWKDPAIRASSLVLALILIPVALTCTLGGKSLELMIHSKRPFISYIDNSANSPNVKNPCALTPENPHSYSHP